MNEILLVEDNPDDVELTLRAFRKSKIANEIVVARDGVEALDYLFAIGEHAGRDNSSLPQLVLLDGKFATLPGVVAEGRRVIANIERSANLFVTKTV